MATTSFPNQTNFRGTFLAVTAADNCVTMAPASGNLGFDCCLIGLDDFEAVAKAALAAGSVTDATCATADSDAEDCEDLAGIIADAWDGYALYWANIEDGTNTTDDDEYFIQVTDPDDTTVWEGTISVLNTDRSIGKLGAVTVTTVGTTVTSTAVANQVATDGATDSCPGVTTTDFCAWQPNEESDVADYPGQPRVSAEQMATGFVVGEGGTTITEVGSAIALIGAVNGLAVGAAAVATASLLFSSE